MTNKSYEQGLIKVVWIEKDPDRIYSKMFENEHEADAFGKTKGNYVIFSLIQQDRMEEFSWKLLPYGKYKLYQRLFRSYLKHEGLFGKILERLPI